MEIKQRNSGWQWQLLLYWSFRRQEPLGQEIRQWQEARLPDRRKQRKKLGNKAQGEWISGQNVTGGVTGSREGSTGEKYRVKCPCGEDRT